MSDHTHPGADRRRGTNAGTRRTADLHPQPSSSSTSTSTLVPSSPCGACKFLRRKCTSGCIFAPYFGTDQGAARFAAVHKVFGASNVSKLLTHIPVSRRHDAVVTISYEAQARLSDPVYGCVSTILALQQQVANLQAELSIVQSQLINSRALAVASALETSQNHIGILQPTYSNNSSASTNLTHHHLFTASATPDMSSCCFAPTSAANYDPIGHVLSGPPAVERAAATPPASGHHLFEPYLRLSRDEEDEEEDSRARHVTFANQIVR